MARTPKTRRSSTPEPALQAPTAVWTPEALSCALKRGTLEEKVALLRTVGILDDRGKLAKKYRSWGKKATRTPEVDDDDG